MDLDFGKDTSNPPAEISKSVFEACMNFINGVPEYCFLFLVGYKYKSRKEMLSVIKDCFEERRIDYVLIQMETFVDEFVDALKCRQKRDFQKNMKKYHSSY